MRATAAAGLAQTNLTYANPTGDLASVVGPTGDVMQVTGYDALGDPTGVTVYPDTGSPATSTQPLSSSIAWDAAQLPASSTMANGVQAVNTWNNGILTQMQCRAPAASGGGLLAQIGFNYDTRGRLYQASDTLGTLIKYKYDKNSNVTRVLDAAGNGPQFVYGSNNELTAMWWADGVHHTSVAYDAAGRVRQSVDERGVACNFVYDGAHRLTDIQWPNTATENVHYAYDIAGRLVSVQDSSGSRAYSYDATGLLHQVTTILSGLPLGHNTYTLTYAYNADGSVASVSSPVGTTQYQYNLAGEPVQLTDGRGYTTTWTYDHIGRPTQQSTSGAGTILTTSYMWGVSGLAGDTSVAPAYLRQITHTLNGNVLAMYTLTHDYLGQVLGIQSVEANGASRSGQYAYDVRGRLTSQQTLYHANANSTSSNSSSYSYDAAGHFNAGTNGWQYNVNGQLTSAPAVAGTPGATGLTWDATGHLTHVNNLALTYDCWGRLAQVDNTPAGDVQFFYDSDGRRICKQVGANKTFYVYEGDDLIAETDGNGSITRTYTWGALGLISDYTPATGWYLTQNSDGSEGRDALPDDLLDLPARRHSSLLWCQAGSSSRFYAFDAQGNTSALVGASGTLLGSGCWSPYGSADLAGQLQQTAFGYKAQSGAYRDSETGDTILSVQGQAYVPAAPTYTAPLGLHDANPYQPALNPVGNSAANNSFTPPDEEDNPLDENGRPKVYKGVRKGLNQLAGQMADTLNTAADANLFYQAGMVATGQDAKGCQVSNGRRVFTLATMASGPVGGFLGKTGKLAKVGRWLRRGKLPVRATIPHLSHPEQVADIMAAMRANNFDYNRAPGSIYGPVLRGVHYAEEGHHRFTAAVRIWIEDGNMEPLRRLIESGNWSQPNSPIPPKSWPFPLK